MMKQRCSFRDAEGKEKDKKSRHHRHENTFNVFDDIMTDIAKNISTHCSTQASNETKNAEPNAENKPNGNDAKQFALNADTFSKAGVVLSNLAQHFASVMDPFAVHEFIPIVPTTQTNSNDPKPNSAQPEVNKANEQQTPMGEAVNLPTNSIPSTESMSSATPMAPATSATADSNKEQVTIEDLIELPAAPRDSSPIPDWALVDANGQVEGDQPRHTGAIPKTTPIPTPIPTPVSVESVDSAQALPNYAVLARDLENHLHHTLKSQASQTPPQMPIVHHPSESHTLHVFFIEYLITLCYPFRPKNQRSYIYHDFDGLQQWRWVVDSFVGKR